MTGCVVGGGIGGDTAAGLALAGTDGDLDGSPGGDVCGRAPLADGWCARIFNVPGVGCSCAGAGAGGEEAEGWCAAGTLSLIFVGCASA